jgi:hypothetical protein
MTLLKALRIRWVEDHDPLSLPTSPRYQRYLSARACLRYKYPRIDRAYSWFDSHIKWRLQKWLMFLSNVCRRLSCV